jgi:hypothetical protein
MYDNFKSKPTKQELRCSVNKPIVSDQTVILLERSVIEGKRLNEVLKVLSVFERDAAAVRSAKGMLIVAFEGYETDNKELYEIETVRHFVRELDKSYPYWLHFFDKESESLFVFMMCLMPLSSVTKQGDAITCQLIEGGLSSLLLSMFAGLNHLHAKHGLSDEETSVVNKEVKGYLEKYFSSHA